MKALGIDSGTTKLAVVIYDQQHGLLSAASAPHNAATADPDPAFFEQDVTAIIQTLHQLLDQLPQAELKDISVIGITGQMHSLLMLRNGTPGNLITWQDQRCSNATLQKFNRISGLTLRNGFGGTTLARMAAAGELNSSDRCAAIGDYLAAVLTGSNSIITDPTHAASWGIYNAVSKQWDWEAIKKLNIPREILPEIRPCGALLGRITPEYSKRFSLPENTMVVNAIGDNQSSILGTGKDFNSEIYLTLGTGAQLSLVTDAQPGSLQENIEIRPFPGNRNLLVSAPLCGGAAFAFLADTINKFRTALGEKAADRSELMNKLDKLAMEYLATHTENTIEAAPHFLGERYDPQLRGVISGLTLDNAEPGALTAALAFGIIRNLKINFPPQELASRRQVIGSGNAVRLNKSIQYAIEKEFALPLKLAVGREEAACGAAILALNALQSL